MKNGESKYSPKFYFGYKTQTVINDLDIDNSLVTSHQNFCQEFENGLVKVLVA